MSLPSEIATDLVEYLVVTIKDTTTFGAVGDELARIASDETIRVLDLAVVEVDSAGRTVIVEPDGFDTIRAMTKCRGVLLSRHDIELVALALEPGDCAVVIVAEDRWAQPLARAARASGGEVRAGERIARSRVEAALARMVDRAPSEE